MATLSIVIPSRNRGDLLSSLLLTCKKAKSPELQFVVSDNSDSPVNLEILGLDSRFKVVRSESRLSMSSNWNLGLENATGNWRVFLGDDDGVIPAELDYLVETLKKSSAEAVVTRFAHYRWPITQEAKGRVSIWLGDPNKFRWTGLTGDAYHDSTNIHFPIPYSRTVFTFTLQERVQKLQGGTLFTATAPDINLGAALAMESNKTELMLGITPFIVGTSTMSNELSDQTKSDYRKLNSIPWLPELGYPLRHVNYLSYAEPVAQARRARGLELKLPNVEGLIWYTLTTCDRHRAAQSYLLEIFPNFTLLIRVLSPVALVAKRSIRTINLFTWAMLRFLLNKEKYLWKSSFKLTNSLEASSHLQMLIDEYRVISSRQKRNSGQGIDERHVWIPVATGISMGWRAGMQQE